MKDKHVWLFIFKRDGLKKKWQPNNFTNGKKFEMLKFI